MKRISWKAHPNLYEVLELFQREQAAFEVTTLQLVAGGAHRQKRRKMIEREQKIKTLEMRWGICSPLDMLRILFYMYINYNKW